MSGNKIVNGLRAAINHAAPAPLFFFDDGTSDEDPPYDCEGCRGGDRWPADADVWRCPVCDTEYWQEEEQTAPE